jgi:predicted Zn-dependent peptidase
MFKGTERFNRDRGTEAARVLQRIGARYNATTWLDRTTYFATVSAEHLGLVADLEADRMRGALVRDEDLASERTVVLNELDRGENEPFEVLLKHAFAHAYLVHPYHHPTIGWRPDVEGVDGATLRGFYDTFYHPDNATVIVTGDVAEDEALDLVHRHFGAIPPAGRPFPDGVPTEADQEGERRFVIRRAGELGSLCLSWKIPDGRHRDLPPLNLATQILTEGVTSRLYQRLVETNRCLGVNAFRLELRDPGLFQIVASLAPGSDHREVEEAIRAEVAALAGTPPRPDEVARAVVQTRDRPGLPPRVARPDAQRADGSRRARGLAGLRAGDGARCGGHPRGRRPGGGRLPGGRSFDCGMVRARRGAGSRRRRGAEAGARTVLPAPAHGRAHRRPSTGGRRPGGGADESACSDGDHRRNPPGRETSMAPDGRFSIPSLTASMLDRGTATRSRLEMARALEDHGLQMGIQCGNGIPSAVLFTVQGLADELPRMVELLVDALRRPVFPEAEFETLRTRIAGALQHEREETFLQAFHA